MEDYFEHFLKKMGAPMECSFPEKSTLDKYQGKLPGQLLEQWAEHGWSGYADGIFWTVDPAQYESVIRDWLKNSGIPAADYYHVIARGAFGDLYLWEESAGHTLKISLCHARYYEDKKSIPSTEFDQEIRMFFAFMDRDDNDFDDLFEQALKKLGPLKADEMYGFVPAIALGGPGEFKHLQKVKIIEHLAFLSQLSPLADWGFPDYETILKLTE
ncbi:GAD-like domain-containing protein [Pseudomonas sp. NPDC090201]|uniref:GAD-like domain-containing protein n=1 Tax=Pseudomonas sp. NPDC090201 TaxID=3364475 RepID=UPI00382E12C5